MSVFNVLIVAHEFSPYRGSECAVGWNIVTQLAKFHNVTVIYASTNQFGSNNYEADVQDYFSKNPTIEKLKLIPIPQTYWGKVIINLNKLFSKNKSSIGIPFLYFFAYNLWQRAVCTYTQTKLNINEIDIIHQLTSISFREPGYLWSFNKPFIWGPISGNVKIPKGFYNLLSFKDCFLQIIRGFLIDIQLNYSYRVQKVSKVSRIIYCVTKDDFAHFYKLYPGKVSQLLDVGTYSLINIPNEIKSKSKHNFIWVGRIVPSKALEIFLYSIANIQKIKVNDDILFTIIGDGPDFKKNYELANKLGLKNLQWLGQLPHDKVFQHLSEATSLIHTSVREATSAIILESLSLGTPVICHDAFGMSIAINEQCGIKVPFVNTQTSIDGFSKSMLRLINNPALVKDLSSNSLIRSKQLTWDNMASLISKDYHKVLNQ